MDFFQAQDRARKQTGVLILAFAGAVLAIIIALYLSVSVTLRFTPHGTDAFEPRIFLWVAVVTCAIVGAGSAYRSARLRAGGPVVAGMLGGRLVAPDTSDDGERRLRNIVEEMALASGVPVPYVYVLPYEPSINAFAAGWTMHDAAIAVTRGALDQLTRDELQGVVAHEFSHILNGDMRLNIRLIGIVFGILLLTILGRGAIHASGRTRGRKGGPEVALPIVGVALVVVGYIGVFFGNVIKAAVSRQREFLADAAAAQFTRNPQALASALSKIGGLTHRSYIHDYHAEELRHLFFAEGVRNNFFGVFATHPPLDARIRKLNPRWDGQYEVLRPLPAEARPPVPIPEVLGRVPPAAANLILAHLATQNAAAAQPAQAPPPLALRRAARANVAAVMASVGEPTAAHVEHAGALIASIPDAVRAATLTPDGAQALVFALLIRGTEAAATSGQRELVERHGGATMAAQTMELEAALDALRDPPRLALLDLSLPALQLLPEPRARGFLATARRMIAADEQVHAFEYALMHILGRQLGTARKHPDTRTTIHSLVPLRSELSVLLSVLAWTGAADEAAARTAFFAGVQRLPGALSNLEMLPRDAADLPSMDAALEAFERTDMGVRRRLLDTCAHAAAGDGVVDAEEAELLRAVAECLDCPLPPLIAAATSVAAR